MQINEIVAGIMSGLFMLPVSIILSFTINHMVQRLMLAILSALLAATAVLILAPLPAVYAWKYHVIEIVIMSDGLTYLLFSHWVTGLIAMIVGVGLIFNNSRRKNHYTTATRTTITTTTTSTARL